MWNVAVIVQHLGVRGRVVKNRIFSGFVMTPLRNYEGFFKSGAKVLHFFEIGKRVNDFSVFLRHGDIAGTNKHNRIMNIKRRSKSPAGQTRCAVAAAKLPYQERGPHLRVPLF